jgi:hypothetical protein
MANQNPPPGNPPPGNPPPGNPPPAQRVRQPKPPKTKVDPIVDDVQKLSKHFPEDVIVLIGFVGISPGAARRFRLYLSTQFDQYIEFEDEDLQWQVQLPKGPDYPLGGSILWLRGSARVQVGRMTNAEATTYLTSLQSQMQFLQGGITGGLGGATGIPMWSGPGVSPQPASGGGCSTIPGMCGSLRASPQPASGGGCSTLPGMCS